MPLCCCRPRCQSKRMSTLAKNTVRHGTHPDSRRQWRHTPTQTQTHSHSYCTHKWTCPKSNCRHTGVRVKESHPVWGAMKARWSPADSPILFFFLSSFEGFCFLFISQAASVAVQSKVQSSSLLSHCLFGLWQIRMAACDHGGLGCFCIPLGVSDSFSVCLLALPSRFPHVPSLCV